MNWIAIYIICLVGFLMLDGAFIGLIASKAYRDGLGKLLRDKPKITPAVVFYVLFVAAILLYAVWPLTVILDNASVTEALGKVLAWGGGLGLICYSTYALTAKSIVKGWSSKVVVVDMIWGTVVGAVITVIGYALRV